MERARASKSTLISSATSCCVNESAFVHLENECVRKSEREHESETDRDQEVKREREREKFERERERESVCE